MVVSGEGDLEARFSHLLQPIRDLTKNWDVDIASQLEDYLEELETITITFDGGSQTMNFAEAALLIQGSACVYSKKVEYLYSLVYQVLDLLASKKKLLQAGSVDQEGHDKDATMVRHKDQDEEFMPLDDLREPKIVDKKIDDDITINIVLCVPKTPLALVPLEEGEKGDNPLLSKRGEVLGSRMDFKMNTALVHSSAFMLLDASHIAMLNPASLTEVFPDARTAARMEVNEESGNNATEDAPLPAAEISLEDDGGASAGIDMDDMDEAPLPVGDDGSVAADAPEQEHRERMQLRKQRKALFQPPVLPKIDVWAPIDPHQSSKSSEKQFRKKKSFRVPKKLESESKKRKHSQEERERAVALQPISEFCSKAYSKSSKLPSNPLKVPAFAEFESLYWAEFKRRQQKLNRQRKMLASKAREELVEADVEEEEEAYQPLGADDDGDDDAGLPGADFQVPEMDLMPGIDGVMDGLAAMGGDHDDGTVVSSFEDLVRHHVEGFMASAQQYAQLTELSRRVAEWEDNILPRLAEEDSHEAFDIHVYGSRVIGGVESSQPPATDPRGKRGEGDSVIPFRRVVERQPPYQVCRMFLATLQLANAYNVEIMSDGQLEKGMNTMKLKLLSTRRHFEELAEYRAPSFQH